jgi:hypothetical protein
MSNPATRLHGTRGTAKPPVNPGRFNRPARPEFDIVWVSNNNQGALNGVVSKNHAHSRQLT